MKTITGIRERTLEEWKSLALNLADLLIQAGLKSSVNRAFGTDELEEFISPRVDETGKRKRQVGRPLLWTPQVLSAVRKDINEIKYSPIEVRSLLCELEFISQFNGAEAVRGEIEARLRSLQKRRLTTKAAALELIDRLAEGHFPGMRQTTRIRLANRFCVALSKARAQ